MAPSPHNCVLPNALRVSALNKLYGKRVILASASPRRKEILATFGISPEIVSSNFKETLPKSSFDNVYEYPVATSSEKAVEVYERLVRENPEDPPDIVIGADTVVLSRITPSTSSAPSLELPGARPDILEKPLNKTDHLMTLHDLNGQSCEVVTGVTVVYPILMAPGYAIRSMDERTLVHFADNPTSLLEAYVESGEGLDRAGGFAIQGFGGLLLKKIDGDFWNVVGFPAAAFFKFLEILIEEEDNFLAVDL